MPHEIRAKLLKEGSDAIALEKIELMKVKVRFTAPERDELTFA